VAVSDVEDAEIRRLRDELERTVERLIEDVRRRSRGLAGQTDRERLATALAIGDDLSRQLDALGSEIGDEFRRIAGTVLAEVGRELRDVAVPESLSTASETTLLAQLGTTIDEVATIGREGSDELRAVIVETLRSSADPEDLVQALAGRLGQTVARAVSLVDTGVMAVDRAVVLAQTSEAGTEWWLFDGPSDSLTRPWCAEHLGYRYDAPTLAGLRNESGPNPASLYGGGFNCRHRFVALDESELDQFLAWRG
jgi:hypothetical protein